MQDNPPSAPNIRQDPITGKRVIVAESRSLRPFDRDSYASRQTCPFCVGAEHLTPPAVAAYQFNQDDPIWAVRVVPNRYPAVETVYGRGEDGELPRHPDYPPATGVHEVIIESPEHLQSITEVSDEHAAMVCAAYRDRIRENSVINGIKSAIVFKNCGRTAGASLQHLHSQLIALSAVPEVLESELRGYQQYYRDKGRCVYCEMIDKARSDRLLVLENERFVAFCPAASRFSYEVWIVPRRHESHFEGAADESMRLLGKLLRATLVRLEAVLDVPAYNYLVHSAPFDSKWKDHYHWHIEIAPRNATLAGFELGSGWFINAVSPELAARRLRDAME